MEQLFATLSRAIEGAPALALSAAFVWGILSVALSPCHLASIPLIIGFIADQRALTVRRAFWLATLFALGILVTISIAGGIMALLGFYALARIGQYGNYLVAVVFFLVGLHLLGVIPLPFSGPGQVGMQRKGLFAAFLLGFIYGLALGPCTFAFMAPVLGITLKAGTTAPLYAAGLLMAYGVGHCGIIAAAGASTEVVQRYLRWNDTSRGLLIVKWICGVLILIGGLYLIYTAK